MEILVQNKKFNHKLCSVQNRQYVDNSIKSKAVNVIPERKQVALSPNYYIAFCGIERPNKVDYANDKQLLSSLEMALDSKMNEIDAEFKQNYESKNEKELSKDENELSKNDVNFNSALGYIKDTDSDLFDTVLNDKNHQYKNIEKNFKLFNSITLNSIDEVKSKDAKYTSFWEKNKKINNKLETDIIRRELDITSDDDINLSIKKASAKDIKKVKMAIASEWIKEQISIPQNEPYNAAREMLEKMDGKDSTNDFIDYRKMKLSDDFDQQTIDKLKGNASNSEKMSAFNTIVGFVGDKISNESGDDLHRDLDFYFQAKKGISFAKEKESLKMAMPFVDALYGVAKKQWSDTVLNNHLTNEMNKKILVNTVEKNDPRIKNFESYNNLELEKKYFMAKYMELKGYDEEKKQYNFNPEDDSLKRIIVDRTMDKDVVEESFNRVAMKVDNEENAYFNKLDSVYDVSQLKKTGEDIQYPEIVNFNSVNSNRTIVDLFYSKINLAKDINEDDETYNTYASSKNRMDTVGNLTKDESILISDHLKEDYLNGGRSYLMQNSLRSEAKNTDIRNKMYDELQKANLNLKDINVSINNQTVSLDNIIKNKITLKSDDEQLKIAQNANKNMDVLDDKLSVKSDEELDDIDKTVAKVIPPLLEGIMGDPKIPSNDEILKELFKLSADMQKNPKGATHNMMNNFRYCSMRLLTGPTPQHLDKSVDALSSLAHNASSSAIHNSISPVFASISHASAGSGAATASGGASQMAGGMGIDLATMAIIAGIMALDYIVGAVSEVKDANYRRRDLPFSMQMEF